MKLSCLSLALTTLMAIPLTSCHADAAPAPVPLTITDNGQSKYVIAVASDAIPAEQTAARELSDHIEKISGVRLEVKAENEVPATAPQILVGAGQRVRFLLPDQKWESLGKDGIVIKTLGNSLILAGGRPRGALYAVYSFLETDLGVRWWTPDASTIPTRKNITIKPQSTVYTPQLSTRGALYVTASYGDFNNPRPDGTLDLRFVARMKMNGQYQRVGPELGGHNSILGWCHTFIQLLPPEKYFAAHPEWYSDPNNGGKPCTAASKMPRGHTWQLCLSNDEARKELTSVALEWINANPEAGMISISQNDTHDARCTCEADVAMEKAEGSPSGPLLSFVNKVAADIEKEYPDFLVETLAYNYTEKPPLHIKPRHNVIVRLCSAHVDVTDPLNSEANRDFRENLYQWKSITPRLYIWNYVANFWNYLVPQPNLNNLGPDIKFLTNNSTIALFEQGDSANEAGDFTNLRVWLLGQLMWNPSLDQRKLETEFLNGYFGAAGPHLRDYLDIIQKSGEGTKLSMYEREFPYLTLDVMNRATIAFRKAEAAVADDPTIKRRVWRERLALDHAWILRYQELRHEAGTKKLAFEGPKDLPSFVAQYGRDAKEFKILTFSEGTQFPAYVSRLLSQYGPRPTLPASIPSQPDSDILEIQDVSFTMFDQGNTTSQVDDAEASDGKAARFRGNTVDWNIQASLALENEDSLKAAPWHCYIVVKVEPTSNAPKTGGAFATGIYDEGSKKSLSEVTKNADAVVDGYQVIDLGEQSLNKQCIFWIAPTNNPNVTALYIDRVILVRDKVAQ